MQPERQHWVQQNSERSRRAHWTDVYLTALLFYENDSFRKDFCFAVVYFFFIFFSPRNLRAPSADRREILHDARCCCLPKKILGAKNMQNLARFRSTSKFGGAPKFLHAPENHQVLLAHPPSGTEASLTTFFKGESKIGLKCNKGALITSKLGGVARRNFGTWRGSRLGY